MLITLGTVASTSSNDKLREAIGDRNQLLGILAPESVNFSSHKLGPPLPLGPAVILRVVRPITGSAESNNALYELEPGLQLGKLAGLETPATNALLLSIGTAQAFQKIMDPTATRWDVAIGATNATSIICGTESPGSTTVSILDVTVAGFELCKELTNPNPNLATCGFFALKMAIGIGAAVSDQLSSVVGLKQYFDTAGILLNLGQKYVVATCDLPERPSREDDILSKPDEREF